MELWILEDYSAEYKGLRMPARCSIASGAFADVHVGVDGVRIEHLVIGPAVRAAIDCMGSAEPGDVVITSPAWKLVSERVLNLGVTAVKPNDLMADATASVKLEFPGSGIDDPKVLAETEECKLAVTDFVTGSNLLRQREMSQAQVADTGTMVRKYISDVAFAALSESTTTNATIHGAIPGFQDTNYLDVMWLQKAMMQVMKCCKLMGVDLLSIAPTGDREVGITMLLTVGLPEVTDNYITKSVEAALTLRQSLRRHVFRNNEMLGVAVAAGKVGVGILINPIRSEVRVVGACIGRALLLSLRHPSNQCEAIVVEEDSAYTGCLQTRYEGFFAKKTVAEPWAINNDQPFCNIKEMNFRVIPFWRPCTKDGDDVSISRGALRRSGLLTEGSEGGYLDARNLIEAAADGVLREGEHRSIVIQGAAGMGKTYLLKHAARYIERLGMPVWYVALRIAIVSVKK
ncbi:hypothetical protein HK101_005375 [Irineochytrium annulatum]|nr:hypothetical protein HK101_005375 [Irineochytrium annulatum]